MTVPSEVNGEIARSPEAADVASGEPEAVVTAVEAAVGPEPGAAAMAATGTTSEMENSSLM
jgi:hypothetical protein